MQRIQWYYSINTHIGLMRKLALDPAAAKILHPHLENSRIQNPGLIVYLGIPRIQNYWPKTSKALESRTQSLQSTIQNPGSRAGMQRMRQYRSINTRPAYHEFTISPMRKLAFDPLAASGHWIHTLKTPESRTQVQDP